LVNGSVCSPSFIPSQIVNLVVAWIDITLIVNDAYLSLIYRFLGHAGLRTAASETLANIVSKKMNSVSKLELIAFLNLTQVVESLETDEDVEFSEALANLVNVQGLELTRILTEV
jgi:exportin-T